MPSSSSWFQPSSCSVPPSRRRPRRTHGKTTKSGICMGIWELGFSSLNILKEWNVSFCCYFSTCVSLVMGGSDGVTTKKTSNYEKCLFYVNILHKYFKNYHCDIFVSDFYFVWDIDIEKVNLYTHELLRPTDEQSTRQNMANLTIFHFTF